MDVPEQYRFIRTDSTIVVRTPKASSKFILLNPARKPVAVLEPEQFFPSGELNCDFIFQSPDTPVEIYVELKGSDFSHALKQLENTLKLLKSSLRPKLCFIVIRRSPTIDVKVQKLLRDFATRNKCIIESPKTQQYQYSL
jgi:hypothetical protein